MIWRFILIWVGISVFTLGAYGMFTYFFRRVRKGVVPDKPGLWITDETMEWREDQYAKFRRLIEDGKVSLAPHLCLSCTDPITPDEEPYCTRCFERLEKEGFFEE